MENKSKLIDELTDYRNEFLNENVYPNEIVNHYLDGMDCMINIVERGVTE
jgi:hypothetical protein